MNEYYQILGLPASANKAQIKSAYRKLALQYHPDINPSQHAHNEFLKITEAYEMLTHNKSFRNSFQRYYQPRSHTSQELQRQAARERARQQAKMHYEEFCRNNLAFQQSWYFRPAQILVLMVFLLGWTFGIFLMLSPVLVSYYVYAEGGFWWQGVLCLPLILAGILVIEQSNRLRKEASLYFTPPKFTGKQGQ